MKKKLVMALALVFISINSFAQLPNYNALSIPENLKKNATVVKRYENIVITVDDIDAVDQDVEAVVTVLNENGANALHFSQHVDRYTSLEDAEVRVFDALGVQIARYKKKDMTTSAVPGMNLVEDVKYTFFSVPAPAYPVTVAYKYHVHTKGTLFIPWYEFVDGASESVENSTFTINVPKDLDIRYKAKHTDMKPDVTEDGKRKTYRWTVKNLAAAEHEEGSVGEDPLVMIAPNRFKFDDFEGDLTSWQKFGLWYSNLYKGLDVLPPDRVAFFQTLVKDCKNDREKARKIYEYLQKNFRYVSIQLGIGGLRPFSATFTDAKKYGDCKALSNFMRAALNTVGIKSYSAVINAGVNSGSIDPDFPSKFSNHVILCIPASNDTTWLECTSNVTDFGVLSSFTENRNALLLTENGGVLVPTPRSTANENTFSAYSQIDLQESGEGKSVTVLSTTGEYKEEVQNYLFNEKEDEQKKYLIFRLGFKQPETMQLKENMEDLTLKTTVNLDIEKVPEFMAGSKMFLSPRLYKLYSFKLPKAEARKRNYYFSHPFTKTDTTVFKLPEGYKTDALPQAKDLKCDFATYSTKYWFDEASHSLYSTARLVLNQHQIPAAKYAEVKKFFDDVLMDDALRIIIKKD